jgi:hypothetical protein
MLLNEGEKILVAHRRLFAKDAARFFIGRVEAYEAGIVRSTGHSFVREMMTGNMVEKAEPRTKLLSLASGTLIVYVLPEAVSLDDVRFVAEHGRLAVEDGKGFKMNLAENPESGRL